MAALRALGRLVVELQSEATVLVVSCGGITVSTVLDVDGGSFKGESLKWMF